MLNNYLWDIPLRKDLRCCDNLEMLHSLEDQTVDLIYRV